MQILIVTVDLAATESQDSMHGVKFCKRYYPSGPSGLFYGDVDTAASKMRACERYVPVRDVYL
jgi:hypothetical protein